MDAKQFEKDLVQFLKDCKDVPKRDDDEPRYVSNFNHYSKFYKFLELSESNKNLEIILTKQINMKSKYKLLELFFDMDNVKFDCIELVKYSTSLITNKLKVGLYRNCYSDLDENFTIELYKELVIFYILSDKFEITDIYGFLSNKPEDIVIEILEKTSYKVDPKKILAVRSRPILSKLGVFKFMIDLNKEEFDKYLTESHDNKLSNNYIESLIFDICNGYKKYHANQENLIVFLFENYRPFIRDSKVILLLEHCLIFGYHFYAECYLFKFLVVELKKIKHNFNKALYSNVRELNKFYHPEVTMYKNNSSLLYHLTLHGRYSLIKILLENCRDEINIEI